MKKHVHVYSVKNAFEQDHEDSKIKQTSSMTLHNEVTSYNN